MRGTERRGGSAGQRPEVGEKPVPEQTPPCPLCPPKCAGPRPGCPAARARLAPPPPEIPPLNFPGAAVGGPSIALLPPAGSPRSGPAGTPRLSGTVCKRGEITTIKNNNNNNNHDSSNARAGGRPRRPPRPPAQPQDAPGHGRPPLSIGSIQRGAGSPGTPPRGARPYRNGGADGPYGSHTARVHHPPWGRSARARTPQAVPVAPPRTRCVWLQGRHRHTGDVWTDTDAAAPLQGPRGAPPGSPSR